MDRLEYLVKTLSRTRRKDYENYVVNAVWNRLGDNELRPVSQQFVTGPDGKRYFIDLYFPQLNIGVECDEAYHLGRATHDRARERTLIDVLSHIELDKSYVPLHVDVSGGFEETEQQIDLVVEKIRSAALAARESGSFVAWEPGRPVGERLGDLAEIRVGDDLGFPSIIETCNALFRTGYRGEGGRFRAFFRPRRGPYAHLFAEKYVLWFAPVHVAGQNGRTWENYVSEDGRTIFEVNTELQVEELDSAEDFERVVFVKARNPITGRSEYRFLGVFAMAGHDTYQGLDCRRYDRTSDHFKLQQNDPA